MNQDEIFSTFFFITNTSSSKFLIICSFFSFFLILIKLCEYKLTASFKSFSCSSSLIWLFLALEVIWNNLFIFSSKFLIQLHKITTPWVEFLHYKKKAMRIITFQSRKYHWSSLFSKLKLLKFNDKALCFWLVSLSIVSCQQSSAIGSLFALIFITMRQLHPLLVNYLNPLSALAYMKKNSVTVNAIDAWNKAQTSLGDNILNDLTPNKIKTKIMKSRSNRPECSVKRVFLKISQNSQETHVPQTCNSIKKETTGTVVFLWILRNF